MSLVSIVIPVYNAEKYLARCLDSIVNQTHKNIEILLINDGSVDNTFNICEEYARNDRRIKLFHKDNQGVSVARNCGIDNATGEYLVFVDADDYVELDYVEKLVCSIEDCKVNIGICGIKEIFNGKISIRKPRRDITGDFGNDYYAMIDFLCVPVCKIYINSIVQKENIRFLREFDYAEDEVFNLSYYRFVQSYRFINQPLYIYEHHKNSLSDKNNFRKNRFLLSYIRKLRIEKDFFDESNIAKKEQIIGEHGIRAVLYMSDLRSYERFVKDVRLIRRNLYKNYIYNKISKIVFATLLNLEIYLPLYLGCKLRNYLRNF